MKANCENEEVSDQLSAACQGVFDISSKAKALAVLLEGQGKDADGLVDLLGLGTMLREWADKLEAVSCTFDDMSIEVQQRPSKVNHKSDDKDELSGDEDL